MTRSYNYWSDERLYSKGQLERIPNITNVVKNSANSDVRYYSSVDAEIYFGDQFVDEVTAISFQVQQQTMPIFGYNSYTFDDIALGSRLISGQFSINFTKNNYLSEVLKVLTAISRKAYTKDVPQTSNFKDADRQRLNTPLWDKGFDLVVGYGEDGKNVSSSYSSVITLNSVQITGCAQQLDSNGEPIQEMYSFIARDMKFSASSAATSNDVESDPSSPEIIRDVQITAAEFDLTTSKLNVSALASNEITIDKISFSFLDTRVLNNLPKIYRTLTPSGDNFEYNLSDNKKSTGLPTLQSEVEKYAKSNNLSKARMMYKINYTKTGEPPASADILFETKIKL